MAKGVFSWFSVAVVASKLCWGGASVSVLTGEQWFLHVQLRSYGRCG